MAKFDGTNLKIKVDGYVIARAMSGSISYSNNLIEVTDKDSGGHAEYIPGKKECELSFDALQDYAATVGVGGFFDAVKNGTEVSIIYSTGTSNDFQWTGTFLAESVELTAPLHDVAGWSGTLRGTGEISRSTV